MCRRRALIQDLWSLWITLNIIDTITCPLGLPSPLEGLGLGVNPDARGGRHTSSARTARFGVPPSRVARRRPGRRRCRFPLSAACALLGNAPPFFFLFFSFFFLFLSSFLSLSFSLFFFFFHFPQHQKNAEFFNSRFPPDPKRPDAGFSRVSLGPKSSTQAPSSQAPSLASKPH